MEAIIPQNIVRFTSEVVQTVRFELTFEIVLALLFVLGYLCKPKDLRTRADCKASATGCKKLGSHHFADARDNSRGFSDVSRGGACGGAPQWSSKAVLPDTSVADRPKYTSQQLTDEEWFFKAIMHLKATQVQRAVDLYISAKKVGLDLSRLSPVRGLEVFGALVTAAVRAGLPSEVPDMLRECRRCGFELTTELLTSVTKLCTAKHFFQECLTIYELVTEEFSLVVDDRTLWSCLLFCSVEIHALDRCDLFWQKLQESGRASGKDFGNMIRCASERRDWQLALSLLEDARTSGVHVDGLVYNIALATCAIMGQVDEGRELLHKMQELEGVVDVITYNTLAKGYAKVGRATECFELYDEMRKCGITPSQVTYGILLDSSINENRMDMAMSIVDSMAEEGCSMNTVLLTTLIKGFARTQDVDKAMQVFEKMTHGKDVAPDLITFSILIKANADSGRLNDAVKLLEAMANMGIVPDEVVFNNILCGCAKHADCKLGRSLYSDMINAGLRPSNATFSIMTRLYCESKLFEEALAFLRTEPSKFSVDAEPRLFSQLLQVCLRERNGRAAVEVYSLLLQRANPPSSMLSKSVATCLKLNMLGTGVELLELFIKEKANIDPRDAYLLREAAVKKNKAQLLWQIDECIKSL